MMLMRLLEGMTAKGTRQLEVNTASQWTAKAQGNLPFALG